MEQGPRGSAQRLLRIREGQSHRGSAQCRLLRAGGSVSSHHCLSSAHPSLNFTLHPGPACGATARGRSEQHIRRVRLYVGSAPRCDSRRGPRRQPPPADLRRGGGPRGPRETRVPRVPREGPCNGCRCGGGSWKKILSLIRSGDIRARQSNSKKIYMLWGLQGRATVVAAASFAPRRPCLSCTAVRDGLFRTPLSMLRRWPPAAGGSVGAPGAGAVGRQASTFPPHPAHYPDTSHSALPRVVVGCRAPLGGDDPRRGRAPLLPLPRR